ncbi:MAG: CopD family protein [Myxococcota bacterium]
MAELWGLRPAELYLPLKALHVVAVVAWFAGLFYIVRLFVYLAEVRARPAAERAVLEPQLQLMARRLWFGITWPAGLATIGFGLGLLGVFWPPPLWLQLKLGLVGLLLGYHAVCHRIHADLQAGRPSWSSRSFRIWNEVATLLLVSIVFLVVMKDAMSVVWGALGLAVFAAVLMAGITVYRRAREGR